MFDETVDVMTAMPELDNVSVFIGAPVVTLAGLLGAGVAVESEFVPLTALRLSVTFDGAGCETVTRGAAVANAFTPERMVLG